MDNELYKQLPDSWDLNIRRKCKMYWVVLCELYITYIYIYIYTVAVAYYIYYTYNITVAVAYMVKT